jgi:hypothetical protein
MEQMSLKSSMQPCNPGETEIRMEQAARSTHGSPSRAIVNIHLGVLALFLPLSIVYLPIYSSEGAGVLTARDVALAVVWCTTTVILFGRQKLNRRGYACLWLCLFALLPGFLGMLSSFSYDSSSPLLGDFLIHMKRFGGPSVLAIAVSFLNERQKSLLAKVAVLALVLAVLLPFTPLGQSLSQDANSGGAQVGVQTRNSGIIFNPNEFGVLAVVSLAIALGGVAGRGAWAWKTAAFAAAAFAVVSSASRAGMAALLCGGLLVIIRSKKSALMRVAVAALLAIPIFIGMRFSDSYQSRMASAVDGENMDLSFIARLDAQWIAINTGVHNPLGVGFINMPTATARYSDASLFGIVTEVNGSDSLYVDYFSATGIAGLACIVATFWIAWRLLSPQDGRTRNLYLQAGLAGVALAALSNVCPASAFTAPFFFVLVGLYKEPASGKRCVERIAKVQIARIKPPKNMPIPSGCC